MSGRKKTDIMEVVLVCLLQRRFGEKTKEKREDRNCGSDGRTLSHGGPGAESGGPVYG